MIEPGVTPPSDLVLGALSTFTDFEEECGTSRLWGGVHFRAAIDEARSACREVGDRAFEFLQRKLNGQSREVGSRASRGGKTRRTLAWTQAAPAPAQ